MGPAQRSSSTWPGNMCRAQEAGSGWPAAAGPLVQQGGARCAREMRRPAARWAPNRVRERASAFAAAVSGFRGSAFVTRESASFRASFAGDGTENPASLPTEGRDASRTCSSASRPCAHTARLCVARPVWHRIASQAAAQVGRAATGRASRNGLSIRQKTV